MRHSFAIIILLMAFSVSAQQSNFSQHNYSVPETAPSKIATDAYASITLQHKNQKLSTYV